MSTKPHPGRRTSAKLTAILAVGALAAACTTSTTDKSTVTTTTVTTATTPRAVAPTVVQSPPPAVPAPYAPLARQLGGWLDAFEVAVGTAEPEHPERTVMGAHLLVANGNRGPALFQPATLTAVDRFLDLFDQLGIRGVTLSVEFPLLLAKTPDSARYLAFYEHVARRIRDHHMTLAVEQNAIFANTVFSPVKPDYTGLTLDGYAREQREMAQVIVDRLGPDYLSVLSEPDTFAHNLGLPALNDPANAARVVGEELDGLRRGRTRVGAGTGTWSPPAFVRALVDHTSIDYVGLHLYPVNPQLVANMDAQVEIATRAHKPLVMDEAWLYKAGAGDRQGPQSNVAAAPEIFRRDSYSFWQPLDERFLDLTARYARAHGFVYVSPFWTSLFFGYLDYGPSTGDLTYAQTAVQANRVQYANVVAGRISETGERYRTITGARPEP